MERNEINKGFTHFFKELKAVNVDGKTEKIAMNKGRALTYLSWVHAWSEMAGRFEDFHTEVVEAQTEVITTSPDGTTRKTFSMLPYHTDGNTAFVIVKVTAGGRTITEHFPVMNNAKASIPAHQVTSRDVSDSIQRAITKCISRFGLGLYLYAGEDLPQEWREELNENQRAQDLTNAAEAIRKATTREEINVVWNKYRYLQANEEFKQAIINRGREITPPEELKPAPAPKPAPKPKTTL